MEDLLSNPFYLFMTSVARVGVGPGNRLGPGGGLGLYGVGGDPLGVGPVAQDGEQVGGGDFQSRRDKGRSNG